MRGQAQQKEYQAHLRQTNTTLDRDYACSITEGYPSWPRQPQPSHRSMTMPPSEIRQYLDPHCVVGAEDVHEISCKTLKPREVQPRLRPIKGIPIA